MKVNKEAPMTAEEREAVLTTIEHAIIDLEHGELSADGCVTLIGLLISVREVTDDPQLVVAREKAKAWIYWTLEGTPEIEAAAPYLEYIEPTPDASRLH